MKQRNAAVPIVGATILGSVVYYFSRPVNKSPEEQRRQRVEHMRGEGLGGAGIGQTTNTGGHETAQPGSGVAPAQYDESRKSGTTAKKEDLPSGGVGGGVGRGGANVRAIEIAPKTPHQTGTSTQASASSFLGGLFGTGGATAGTGTDPETKDTRVASNYAGTPTKRHADWHDQHQPRVERPGQSEDGESSDGKLKKKGSSSLSSTLQGWFGQGGAKTTNPDDESPRARNTKIASNHTETPTKRS